MRQEIVRKHHGLTVTARLALAFVTKPFNDDYEFEPSDSWISLITFTNCT